jgi:hypothetical protein
MDQVRNVRQHQQPAGRRAREGIDRSAAERAATAIGMTGLPFK